MEKQSTDKIPAKQAAKILKISEAGIFVMLKKWPGQTKTVKEWETLIKTFSIV